MAFGGDSKLGEVLRRWRLGESSTNMGNLPGSGDSSSGPRPLFRARNSARSAISEANVFSTTLQIRDWSTRNYTFYLNCLGVALCFFSIIGGGLQRWFHNYKVRAGALLGQAILAVVS